MPLSPRDTRLSSDREGHSETKRKRSKSKTKLATTVGVATIAVAAAAFGLWTHSVRAAVMLLGVTETAFVIPTHRNEIFSGGTPTGAESSVFDANADAVDPAHHSRPPHPPSGVLGLPAPCGAPNGLDASFGVGGKLTTPVGPDSSPDVAYAVAVQSDGKIVAVGNAYTNGDPTGAGNDFAVVRYNVDGSLDQSFGTGGKVMTDFGAGSADGASAVAIQADGKIVAAGSARTTNADFAVARYNSDGSLDAGFGTGGKVITDFAGSHDFANRVAIQSDGKIIVSGQPGGGVPGSAQLARYEANGSLDTTFGAGGRLIPNFGVGDVANSMALQSDGKIVFVGHTESGGVFAARVDSTGQIDPSFGTAGIARSSTGGSSSVAIQPDGKIIAAGSNGFRLIRYNADGTVDTSFGSNGTVVTPFMDNVQTASAVAVQPDGRIIVAGSRGTTDYPTGYNRDFAAVRYNANGSLDTSFNGIGSIKTAISNNRDDFALAVALQPDGRFIVAGHSNLGGPTGGDFALVRYQGTCEIAVEGPTGQDLTDGLSGVNMGLQPVGVAGGEKVFTIRNTGSEPLAVGTISVDGPHSVDYSVNTSGTSGTVAPGSSTTFAVTFTPGGPGTRTAALRIANNDLNESPFDVILTGTGISGVTFSLTVSATNGTVTSSPAGINCPGNCTGSFDEGAVVNLTARPNTGYRFAGWTGGASGTANPLPVTVSANTTITAVFERPPQRAVPFDYDGDRRADLSLRRPSDSMWYFQNSASGFSAFWHPGSGNARMAPADYDGDGKIDVAVYSQPSNWSILYSSTLTLEFFTFGQTGDLPVSADRDGDGRAEVIVFRPSTNTWHTRSNTVAVQTYGAAGDKPVLGDFDGDGRADLAVYRPSNHSWYLQRTSGGYVIIPWGEDGDIPVPADYDGDGATDVAMYRPSTGGWYIIGTTAGWMIHTWGEPGDAAVPADFDGDGRTDLAIFRPSSSTWYVVNSSNYGTFIRQFGQTGDVPTPTAFIY